MRTDPSQQRDSSSTTTIRGGTSRRLGRILTPAGALVFSATSLAGHRLWSATEWAHTLSHAFWLAAVLAAVYLPRPTRAVAIAAIAGICLTPFNPDQFTVWLTLTLAAFVVESHNARAWRVAIIAGAMAWPLLVPYTPAEMASSLFGLFLPMLLLGFGVAHLVQGALTREREAIERLAAERQQVMEARLKLATEMHDSVARQLSLIVIHAENLARQRPTSDEIASQSASDLAQEAREARLQFDRLMNALHADVQHLGGPPGHRTPASCTAALTQAVDHLRSTQHPVEVDAPRQLSLKPPIESLAAGVIAEAVANVIAHSPAGAGVGITVEEDDTGLGIEVANATAGPSVDAAAPQLQLGTRRGLTTASQAVRQAGGILTWGHRDGEWVVRAWLPR